MTERNRIEKAKERAKQRAKEIFRPVPPEIEKELEKETTLGNPKNLVQPEDENE